MDLYTGLSIGELSKRTGIGISTLRAWERRYGFPTPQRAVSGHRRYAERDVDALVGVLHDRHEGSTLEAAIRRAAARAELPRASVFATVRDALRPVEPTVLSQHAMLALSHAIEDEAASRADAPVFVGTFQTNKFWRASRARWRDIAARAEMTLAMAVGVTARHDGSLWEVPVQPADAIAREWVVICDAANFAGCVVAVELPQNNGGRRFEALWTVEPPVVRAALHTTLDLAAAAAPALRAAVPARVERSAVATYDTLRVATSLTTRVVRYLDPATVVASRAPVRSRRSAAR